MEKGTLDDTNGKESCGRPRGDGEGQSRCQKALSAEQAAATLATLFDESDHEECWIALLDSQGVIKSTARMSSGTEDTCPIDVAAITQKAVETGAAGLILCHNHPFGSALPSAEDITETIRLRLSLSLFGIRLADHIIFAGGRYFSFYKSAEADISDGGQDHTRLANGGTD